MKNLLLILITSIFIFSCDSSTKKQAESTADVKLKVFAVNYPLLFFAERIGGEDIDLIYPIPDDVDPAYWVPYDALEEIQAADLILTNGANYAKWMEKVSLPSSKVINTSEAFQDKYIKIQVGETHSHGADGEHVHYGYAFTTWLDLEMAMGQAKAVYEALINKRPDLKEKFNTNHKALETDLNQLNTTLKEVTKKLGDQNIFGSHPVYQYLAGAYGLKIYSEHWEPGEKPSDKQWSEFMHNLDHHPSMLMLWEGEPSEEIKDKLMKENVWSIVFNPCGNKPADGDFISVMKQNIENLQKYIDEAC